jgi:hypothetical protein
MSNPRKAFEQAIKKIARGTPAEDVAEAIGLLDLLPNAVAFWVEAHAGNRELARENTKKVRQAVDLLSEVLSSMPKSMSYMVVGLEGRTLNFKDADDLIDGLKAYGIRHTGYQEGRHLRPELRGQPTFDQLLGPMHGGAGKVRYETGEVYERLSR